MCASWLHISGYKKAGKMRVVSSWPLLPQFRLLQWRSKPHVRLKLFLPSPQCGEDSYVRNLVPLYIVLSLYPPKSIKIGRWPIHIMISIDELLTGSDFD